MSNLGDASTPGWPLRCSGRTTRELDGGQAEGTPPAPSIRRSVEVAEWALGGWAVDVRGRSCRDLLVMGGGGLAALAFARLDRLVAAAPLDQGEVVIPWLDQPAEVPPPARGVIGQQLVWEELDAWITPTNKFFTIAHFGPPTIDLATWSLDVTGLVKQPLSLTLDQIKARPRQEVTFTIECSGN